MNIQYIYNSGMLLELQDRVLLFDYYRGDIPKSHKPMYIFASHSHYDHFTPHIFSMDATFILSSDIPCDRPHISLSPGDHITLDNMSITCAESNDEGVAFHVSTQEGNILHFGDLNDWDWDGEDENWLSWQKQVFLSSLKFFSQLKTDVAMVPVDPRLGKKCTGGITLTQSILHPEIIIPIHFELGGGISKIKKPLESIGFRDKIKILEKSGESVRWNRR